MIRRITPYCLLVASFLLVLMSCTPSVPDQYIQPGDLEDILYDYHLADAMYRSDNNAPTTMISYKAAVLKKYDVTEAEFDSSMIYYTRHTRLLQKIYESLAERMSKEALALGASESEISRYSLNSADGDTANIWRGDRSMVFSPYRPFNLSSYSFKADSTFRPGDKLWLNFDTQFIYQDGSRDAVAVMAVRFNNDSVATQNLYVSAPNHYTLQIADNNGVGIKEISGFFILNNNNPDDAYSTTLKLMILSNISLVRIHSKKPVDKPNTDSTRTEPKRPYSNDSTLQPPPHSSTGNPALGRRVPATAKIE